MNVEKIIEAKQEDLFDMDSKPLSSLHSNYWSKNLPEIATENNLISLASYRRAVSRFIKIMTGKDIKVDFTVETSGGSTFDNNGEKSVSLTSKIENKEFDVIVGLALHESEHILDSDFSILARAKNDIKHLFNTKMSLDKQLILLKTLTNYIEDKRLDKKYSDLNPGYKEYWIALYKKYFSNKYMRAIVKSSFYRKPDFFVYNENGHLEQDIIESYLFRILSFSTDVTKNEFESLDDLKKIYNIIDLKNIDRITDTQGSYTVAKKVMEIILKHYDASQQQQSGNQNQNQNNQNQSGQGGQGGQGSQGGNQNQNNDQNNENGDGDQNENGKSNESKNGNKNDNQNNGNDTEGGDSENGNQNDEKSENDSLLRKNKKNIKKLVKNMIDATNGDIKKASISESSNAILKAIEESGMTIEHVLTNSNTNVKELYGTNNTVIKTRNFTKSLLGITSMASKTVNAQSLIAVKEGYILGKMLANRLQIRTNEKIYTSTRKLNGKIDKRLLHTIGVGSEAIFKKSVKDKDKFGNIIVHISGDASSSMNSNGAWRNMLVTMVALAYAATKIKTFDVVLTFRGTTKQNSPEVLIAFDSRKDSWTKIQTLFPHLTAEGITPEGLCFEAIMEEILQSLVGMEKGFFINFSDGMPNMTVNGLNAETICKNAVMKIKKMGIKVLSFFINSGGGEFDTFADMYGASCSKNIKTTQLVPLARELNKMFSEK